MKPQWKDKSLLWKTARRWIVVSVDAAVSGSSVCLVQCIVGRDWKMIWYSQEHFYQAHTGERDQISPLRKGSVKNEFVVLKLTGNELKRSSSRLPVCVLWTVTAAERRRAFVGRRRLVKSRAVHSWEVQLCVRVCVCLQLQTPDSVTARLRNGHKKMNQLKKDERETQKVSTWGENITSEEGALLFCAPGRSVVMFWAAGQKFSHFICLSQWKLIQNLRAVVTTTTCRDAHSLQSCCLSEQQKHFPTTSVWKMGCDDTQHIRKDGYSTRGSTVLIHSKQTSSRNVSSALKYAKCNVPPCFWKMFL